VVEHLREMELNGASEEELAGRNAMRQVEVLLSRSVIVSEARQGGATEVAAALYDMASGEVKFL
jgi:carbonic anhydrase